MVSDTVTLNKYGVNTAIGYRVLSDDEMRQIGFTDRCADSWYYMKRVSSDGETSFNVTIDKNGVDDLRIDVLDEMFCQPYDYQRILHSNPTHSYASAVRGAVENEMERLQESGVLFGHERGAYI